MSNIQKISENVYLVNSSNGRDIYKIIINGSIASCTCKGFVYNRRCTHIELVKTTFGKKLRAPNAIKDDGYAYVDKYSSFFENIPNLGKGGKNGK